MSQASLQGSITLKTKSIDDAIKKLNSLQSTLKTIENATRAYQKAENALANSKTNEKLKAQVDAEKAKVKALQETIAANNAAVKAEQDRAKLFEANRVKIEAAEKSTDKLSQRIQRSSMELETQQGSVRILNQALQQYTSAVTAADGDTVALSAAKRELNKQITSVELSLGEFTAASKKQEQVTKGVNNVLDQNAKLLSKANTKQLNLRNTISLSNLNDEEKKRLLKTINDEYFKYAKAIDNANGDVKKLASAQSTLKQELESVNRAFKTANTNQQQLVRNERAVGALTLRYQQSIAAIKNTTLSTKDQDIALKHLEQSFKEATTEIHKFGAGSIQAVQANNAFRQGLVKNSDTLRKNLAGVGRGAGQAGIQVQQFVGQIQGGIDPMIALSQQSADLGWALGMPFAGAIAGIAFSMGTFLAPAMFDGKDATEELTDALEKLKGVSVTVSGSTKSIAEDILELAKTNFDLARVEAGLNLRNAQKGIKDSVKTIKEELGSIAEINLNDPFEILGGKKGPEVNVTLRTLENFGNRLGLSGKQAEDFGRQINMSFRELEKTPTVDGITNFANQITALQSDTTELNKSGREFMTTLISVARSAKGYGEVAELMEKFGTSSKDALLDFANTSVLKDMQNEMKVLQLAMSGGEEEAYKLQTAISFGADSFDELSASTQKLILDLYELREVEDKNKNSLKTYSSLLSSYNESVTKRQVLLTSATEAEREDAFAKLESQAAAEKLALRIEGLTKKHTEELAAKMGLETANKTHKELTEEVTKAYQDQIKASTDLEIAAKRLSGIRSENLNFGMSLDMRDINTMSDHLKNAYATMFQIEQDNITANFERNRQLILAQENLTGEERRALITIQADKATSAMNDIHEKALMVSGGYWQQWLIQAQNNMAQTDAIVGQALNSFSSDFGKGFADVLFEGASAAETLSNVFKNVASNIVAGIAEMAAQWVVYNAVESFARKQSAASAAGMLSTQAAAMSVMAGLNAYASAAAVPVTGYLAAPAASAAAVATTGTMASTIATLLSGAAAFKTGGYVSGPGTGTSDSIPARLSNGEYVINARAVDMLGTRYLDMINSGSMPMLASGGSVGSNYSAGMGNSGINMTVEIVNEGNSNVEITRTEQTTNENGEPMMRAYIRDIVRQEMDTGNMDRSLNRNYGVTRRPTRR